MRQINFPSEKFAQKLEWVFEDTSLRNVYMVQDRLEFHFPNNPEFSTLYANFEEKDDSTSWTPCNRIKTGRIFLLDEIAAEDQVNVQNTYYKLEKILTTWLADENNLKGYPSDVKLFNNLLQFPENTLCAGSFDPSSNANFFPVRVAWGCRFQSEKNLESGILEVVGRNASSNEPLPQIKLEDNENKDEKINLPSTNELHAKPAFYTYSHIFVWLLILFLITIIAIWITPACNLKILGNCNESNFSVAQDLEKIKNLELELTKSLKFCKIEEKVEIDLPRKPSPVQTKVVEPDTVDKRLEENEASFGALNFTLSWDTKDDLDLFVTCPNGESISYRRSKKSQNSCGTLNIDQNKNSHSSVTNPVEHIIVDAVKTGDKFSIVVNRHSKNSSTAAHVDFSLRVKSENILQEFKGKVSERNQPWKAEFKYEAN
jgi:hypothetical protein